MSWDQQTDETDEWYDRFRLYLYMGPDRTIAAAHRFATRLMLGAAPQPDGGRGHDGRHLSSWQRAARRFQWQERAALFDAEFRGKTVGRVAGDEDGTDDERLRMIAELLHQVYGVLRHADLLTLTKAEARQLLPTLRLFFRDLLRFHQSEAARLLANSMDKGGENSELNADTLVKFMLEAGGVQALLAEVHRVSESQKSEASWQPLRDLLAQLYPDEASARRIAAQAHLDSARIHFSARAVDGWHAILTEADHAGLVENVIRAAQQEYGGNVELAKAVGHYHLRQRRQPPQEKQPVKKQVTSKQAAEKTLKRQGTRVRRKV